jgi:diguanylate cyclase (GGDEF)-like protein
VLVRYGGDEFVILLSGDVQAAEAVARRIQEAVRQHPWSALASGLRVTVSIGVGLATHDKANPLAAADAALLSAKRAGRDRVAAHTH